MKRIDENFRKRVNNEMTEYKDSLPNEAYFMTVNAQSEKKKLRNVSIFTFLFSSFLRGLRQVPNRQSREK